LLASNAVDFSWQSRIRKALRPEIRNLQRLIDAHTDRYFKFGDYSDQQQADVLRRRLTELKQELLRAEEIQAQGTPHSEQTPHS
jgi:hypothetical protein